MRNVAMCVSKEFHKELKIKVANEGINVKQYLITLIKKDFAKKNEIIENEII